MLLVWDTCNIAVGPSPERGLTLRFNNVEGLPEGLEIMVPVARETAVELIKAAQKTLGVEVFSSHDMSKVARRGEV